MFVGASSVRTHVRACIHTYIHTYIDTYIHGMHVCMMYVCTCIHTHTYIHMYVTRGAVGSYGMVSTCESDFDPAQPVADGPVGPFVTCGPVGSYEMVYLWPCLASTLPTIRRWW